MAPVVSLGVVYLPAILLISIVWGRRLGLLASVLSAAAFNFFHIPPLHRFTIADEENWVALGAFVFAAVLSSAVAELARSRAVEAERGREGRTGPWRSSPPSPASATGCRRRRSRPRRCAAATS